MILIEDGQAGGRRRVNRRHGGVRIGRSTVKALSVNLLIVCFCLQ